MGVRVRSSHISTTISISLVLFLVGLTMVLLLNAGHLSTSLRENIRLSLLIRQNTKQSDILKLKKQLDMEPYFLHSEYVSKQQAAQKLQKELGENFIDLLGYNPLPSSIDIRLKAIYTQPDSMLALEKRLKKIAIVKGVYYPKAIVRSLSSNIQKVSVVLLFFAALLLLVTIGLISNSVRLAIYADRFLIRTQELVGATQFFISKPYIGQALLQGIGGGIIAIALLTGFVLIVQNKTEGFLSTEYLLLVYLFTVVLGATIAGVASYFSVRKYVNIKLDQLYT